MLQLPPLKVKRKIVRLPLPEAEAARLYCSLPDIDPAELPAVREWNRLQGAADADAARNLLARAGELRYEGAKPTPFAELFLAAMSRATEFAAAVEQAKLQALYHFVYGLSHEFNNPLANIATRAQTLLRDETDPERRRKLATMNAQAFRGHEMLADLMLFAKPPALKRTKCELSALIRRALVESAEDAREQGTSIVFEPAGEIAISADRDQLTATIKAIVRNSLEALSSGGKITVDLRRELNTAIIEICDRGPGISAEIRPFIFNPFFSGREAGRGLGNGLAKSWKIVDLHGGKIAVDSPPTGGATVRIQLPI